MLTRQRYSRVGSLLVSGWLLMLPPVDSGKRKPLPPVRQWSVLQAFDTAAGCEAERAKITDPGIRRLEDSIKHRDIAGQQGAMPFASATCVPSEHIYPPAKPN